MSRTPHILVPSQLPDDTEEFIRTFVLAMRDSVFADFLSGRDTLEECLQRGAALRFRWLNDIQNLPTKKQKRLIRQWLTPPSEEMLSNLEPRAARILPQEKIFQLIQAFAHSFSGSSWCLQNTQQWQAHQQHNEMMYGVSGILGVATEQDVLSILWLMMLYEDIPTPSPESLDQLYARFINVASDYLTQAGVMLRSTLVPASKPTFTEIYPVWFERHPALHLPVVLLIGLAHAEPTVAAIQLIGHTDPELAGAHTLEIRVSTRDDPEATEERLMKQILRAGLLSVQMDDTGSSWFLRVEAA